MPPSGMHLRRRTVPAGVLVLVTLLSATPAFAAPSPHTPLDRVICSADAIAVGRVRFAAPPVKIDRGSVTGGDTTIWHYGYGITITEVLSGRLEASDVTVAFVSPGSLAQSSAVPASGIEHALQRGQRYVLLLKRLGTSLELLRAEPFGSRSLVITTWRRMRCQSTKRS